MRRMRRMGTCLPAIMISCQTGRRLLQAIPGIGQISGALALFEVGDDMARSTQSADPPAKRKLLASERPLGDLVHPVRMRSPGVEG